MGPCGIELHARTNRAASHGADTFLDVHEFDDVERLMGFGELELGPSRHEYIGPTRPMPPDLLELFWAVTSAAVHRRLVATLGYDDPPASFVFERFETLAVMTGGIGIVIAAYDPELDRKVAIKLWNDDGPAAQAALLDEAKTLARLTHPNVVRVYDTGRWRERVYFMMEWIEGADGYQWLQQPRTWRTIREVFLAVGEGLAAAHDAGIQHRDFNPNNMLIGDDGRVVVADFGVADSLGAAERYEPGQDGPVKIVGTRGYVAPERLRCKPGDARSDQFSFCVTLWEALHGCRPYAGESRVDVLEAIERGEISSGPLARRVPYWLSRVVRKGLADDPDQRFASMRELLQALREEPAEYEEIGSASEVELDESDGRLLHAPAATGGPTWGVVLGAMVVTGLLVLGSVVVGLEYGRASERARADQWMAERAPNGEAERQPTPPADGSADDSADDSQCSLAEYDPMPDYVVREVCRLTQIDDYEQAHALWEAESAKRDQPGADSLIIARTFSARVDALVRDDPETAREAAKAAAHWARQAVTALEGDELRQSDAVRLYERHASG